MEGKGRERKVKEGISSIVSCPGLPIHNNYLYSVHHDRAISLFVRLVVSDQ